MDETEPGLALRDDLEDVAPYASPLPDVRYRLNTNESPYPPPPVVVDEALTAIKSMALNRYPDVDASRLHRAIARYVGHPREGIWVANGSNEVFMHLFLAFGGAGRSSMTFEPTYPLHSLIPRITATRVTRVRRGDDLHIDVDAAVQAIERERPDIVIVCSPNNPTGDLEPLGTIEALLHAAPGVVVVDEAYIDFAEEGSSATPLLPAHRNLLVSKTFSKAWRLAGVRVGYLLADPSIVSALGRVRLPYHLSSITQAFGEAVLKHADDTMAQISAIRTERQRISDSLRERNLPVYPSQANFVLFRVGDAESVWNELVKRDVLIRRYAGVAGLEGCLRVTVGLPEETDAFVAALDEVLDE